MNVQHLRDLIARPKYRVQCRLRLLKDHRNAIPAHLHHFIFGKLENIPAFEQDLTVGDAPRGADQAQDGEGAHALATPGFADQPERLALDDIKRHIIDRLDDVVAVFDGKVLDEITHVNQPL